MTNSLADIVKDLEAAQKSLFGLASWIQPVSLTKATGLLASAIARLQEIQRQQKERMVMPTESSVTNESVSVTPPGVESGSGKTLETRVEKWVITRIGESHMLSKERAIRLFEEASELIQSEGISQEQASRQLQHVYNRPAGEPHQEAAGVAVTLLGWCAANKTTFRRIAEQELARIEAKPVEQIRGSVARKADADLVTVADPVQETKEGK